MFRKFKWLMTAGAAIAFAASAQAQAPAANRIVLPAQDLAQSLRALSRQTSRNIIAPSALVRGRQAPALSGSFTAEDAVRRLLAGSDLSVGEVGDSLVISAGTEARQEPGPSEASGQRGPGQDAILVTGTRIRGGAVASPVIEIGREDIRNSGQLSLGDVIRSLPQSFGGGQNPGVGTNVPASSGVDVGGGSSVNLRGLGSDATLTLLNGHRLSYSASRQSIDVSAIPLSAVQRVEIVADGASAIYGSDAVAGVANIILRRDVRGIETGARLGSSTVGGDFQQVYDVVAGTQWGSGGVVAAFEYGSSTAIEAEDRPYAASRSPGLRLYPALRHHNASLTAHQRFSDAITFEVDALYNHRNSESLFPLNAAGDLKVSSGRIHFAARSYAVAPALRARLSDTWEANLVGSYGHDRVEFAADLFFAGTKLDGGAGHYRNIAKAIEVNAQGSVFELPAGPAKLALGGGYRSIDFLVYKGSASFQNASRSQDSRYVFGELNLPLVSSGQQLRFVHHLTAVAALRYEKYPGVGEVATPKLGLVYGPSPDFELKGSWGRSFRAPTLLQQYNPLSVSLVSAKSVGGAGLPSGSTALLVQGGNPALRPERAETWSATFDLHPRAVPGLSAQLSYFSTRYRDRIVTPIGATAVALSNPIYAGLVRLRPTAVDQAALIAASGTFVNSAGIPYDPASVAAIVDNTNLNAGRQNLHGVDLLLRYRHALGGDAGSVTLTLDGAYLDSDQQLTASQPVVQLAGTLFNPPHIRARGGVAWSRQEITLVALLNHNGAVTDRRFTPSARIGGLTTADLTLRMASDASSGLLRGLEVSLSLLNAFNAKPAPIRTTSFTDTPYDSTNNSPVGRFIAFGVRKSW
jgi:iron complex outermembrane receptor protein